MKVYQAIAQALVDLEVDPLFGLMGDGNLYMVDSYVRDGKGTYIRAVHEAGAVLMALGYAQVSGRLGVATVTHGPALTNTMTALVEGVKCAIPMVLLAGDTSVEDRGHLQKIDQRELVTATGAGFEPLRTPDTVAEDVTRAFHRALAEKRPIVLNMPIEFQWLDAAYEKATLRFPAVRSATVSSEDMNNAIGIIASARRPVVLAGRGAMADEARASIIRFAERIEAPLATTLRGKGLFQNEPFNLGIFGTLSHSVANDAITGSDCVISFGASFNKYTAGLGSLVKNKRIIQVNPEAREIGRFTPADAGLVGDPGLIADAMVALLDEAEIPGSGGRTEELRKQLDEYQPETRMAGSAPRAGTVDMLELLHTLNGSFPEDRVFVTDAGRFLRSTWPVIDVQHPRHYVHTLGFASIGLGVGEAIGAAVAARGERPTLLVTGDGGLMLSGLSELSTAARENLDLVIVVCNDGSYGAEYRQFRSKNMDPGMSLLEWPEFAPVAEALGVPSLTVRSSDELQSAMEAMSTRDRRRPLLIDVKLDPALIRDY